MTTKIIGIDIVIKGSQHSKALKSLKAEARGAFKDRFSPDHLKSIEDATNLIVLVNELNLVTIPIHNISNHNISNNDIYIIGHQRNELNSQDMKNLRGFLHIMAPYIKNKSKINFFEEGSYHLKPIDAVWYIEDKKMVFYDKEIFRAKIQAEKEKRAISRAIKAGALTKAKVVKL